MSEIKEVLGLGDVKNLVKEMIDREMPVILDLRAKIEVLTKEKAERFQRLELLRADIEEIVQILERKENAVLDLLGSQKIRRVLTPQFIVQRTRNASPTVTVMDINNVPEEYIILKPKVDKRGIQSKFSKTGVVPGGVSMDYDEYLIIKERKEEE